MTEKSDENINFPAVMSKKRCTVLIKICLCSTDKHGFRTFPSKNSGSTKKDL